MHAVQENVQKQNDCTLCIDKITFCETLDNNYQRPLFLAWIECYVITSIWALSINETTLSRSSLFFFLISSMFSTTVIFQLKINKQRTEHGLWVNSPLT